jgi:hypothetical protein
MLANRCERFSSHSRISSENRNTYNFDAHASQSVTNTNAITTLNRIVCEIYSELLQKHSQQALKSNWSTSKTSSHFKRTETRLNDSTTDRLDCVTRRRVIIRIVNQLFSNLIRPRKVHQATSEKDQETSCEVMIKQLSCLQKHRNSFDLDSYKWDRQDTTQAARSIAKSREFTDDADSYEENRLRRLSAQT